MKLIDEIQQEIISDFNLFSDWTQKYEYLIDLGKELKVLDAKHKTEENLIKASSISCLPDSLKESPDSIFVSGSTVLAAKRV